MSEDIDKTTERPKFFLHEAMAIVLKDAPNFTATTSFLSDEIWERELYWQENGGKAFPDQMFLRARKYPAIFEVIERNTIRLIKTGD
jgi:hypothetical protein